MLLLALLDLSGETEMKAELGAVLFAEWSGGIAMSEFAALARLGKEGRKSAPAAKARWKFAVTQLKKRMLSLAALAEKENAWTLTLRAAPTSGGDPIVQCMVRA